MCIRDRGDGLRPADRVRHRLQLEDGHRERDGGVPHRHGACLLYTSDAADERSSVDLGGRRIIKKKRNI